MRKNLKTLPCLVALMALFLVSVPASATPLPAPGSVVPSLAAGTFTAIGGADTGLLNFTFKDAFGNVDLTGTVREWVGHDTANPFGSGNVSFLYQVSAVTAVGGDIARVSGASYKGFLADVSQAPQIGPSAAGSFISSTAERNASGSTIGFNFDPVIDSVGTSWALLVNTNAPTFTKGSISVIDDNVANFQGFAPAATPEPTSVILFSCTFACLGGGALIRRFKSAKAVA